MTTPSLVTPGSDSKALSLRVETDFSTLDSLREPWDQAVTEFGSPIYLTFDWVRIWWQFYGAGKTLRIFVWRDGSRIVGILPLYIESIGAWPLRSRVARLIGANVPRKAFDPPVDARWSERVFAELATRIFEDERADLLAFGPVSEAWPAWKAFHAATQAVAYAARSAWHIEDVVTVFRLPATFEAYLASLSKNERQSREKRFRQLSRDRQVTTEVVSDATAVLEEFERFREHHTAQWNAEGKAGHFMDWPDGIEFHRALVRAMSALDRLLFVQLTVDGQVVANRYVYRVGDRVYAELPSRAVGADWDRMGLGTTAYFEWIESAIGLGLRHVNSGLGSYEYKVRLGGQEFNVGTWRVMGPGAVSRFRARLFLAMARMVVLVVEKVWYCRILPRLPLWVNRSRKLFWLRFDV